MSQTKLLQLEFPYEVIRSKRKSAAIHVRGGRVEVRIPSFVNDQWALEFLYSKRQWVQGKLAQQADREQQRPQIKVGEHLLWLGQPRQVQFDASGTGVAMLDNQCVIGAIDDAQAEKRLVAFFKHQAKAYMQARTQIIAKHYGVLDQLNDVRFRRTKTKWGHCTSKGVIQYNWLIMGAPMDVIEYLICHEVSHLIHPNHSRAFWQTVKRFCPNYETHQRWLKQNSHTLSWC